MLEERRYRPLGEGSGDRGADVRFIVGTNTDLYAATRAGRFREDLYYRINVLPVKVLPLVERRDEIPRWAAYMLDRHHRGTGRAGQATLSADAEQALSAQSWPGNLRQLDNIVRRAYALALMRLGASVDELRLDVRDVQQALAYEGDAGSRPLLELFQLTAAAFVAEAERRRAAGGVLDLDLADALRGFVLGAAVQKLGNKEDAFRLLGKEAMVQIATTRRPSSATWSVWTRSAARSATRTTRSGYWATAATSTDREIGLRGPTPGRTASKREHGSSGRFGVVGRAGLR